MKIAFLVFECMAKYNGAIVQLVELATGLSKLGHDVVVYTPDIGRYPEKTIFTIKYVPVINKPLLRNLSYVFSSFFYFIVDFSRKKPDVVVISEYYLDPVPSLVCLLFGCPSFFYVNGIAAEDLKLPVFAKPIMYLVNLFQRFHCKVAKKVFAITETVKFDLSQRHNILFEKIEVVNDGVDPEKFRPYDSIKSRKCVGLPINGKYIGFVGGLFPYHGVDYLIKAAPLLVKVMSDIKFVIVGDGKMKPFLINLTQEAGVSNNFIFTGHVPHSQIPYYISAFDLCIVFFKPPRKNAGDPVKTYEYMACAKPVLASDVKGYGDFVESIGAGVSVNAAVPELLVETIVSLMNDSAKLLSMGKRGRAAVLANHTWIHRAGQIYQQFEVAEYRKNHEKENSVRY